MAALEAVRKWGGVLEHPEASHAWKTFHIVSPPRYGGWVPAGLLHQGAWTCCVEQGHYGHRAPKPTWLYFKGTNPPELKWGPSGKTEKLEQSYRSSEARRIDRAQGVLPTKRPSERERLATPIPFRDLLIDMARGTND